MKVEPSIMLPITRKQFPSSARSEIMTEEAHKLEGEKVTSYNRLEIIEGRFHDFITGFGFTPYKLVRTCGELTTYTNVDRVKFNKINSQEVIEELSEDVTELPKDVKARWEVMIAEDLLTQGILV